MSLHPTAPFNFSIAHPGNFLINLRAFDPATGQQVDAPAGAHLDVSYYNPDTAQAVCHAHRHNPAVPLMLNVPQGQDITVLASAPGFEPFKVVATIRPDGPGDRHEKSVLSICIKPAAAPEHIVL